MATRTMKASTPPTIGIPVESAIANRKTPPGPQDTRVGMILVWMIFPRRAFGSVPSLLHSAPAGAGKGASSIIRVLSTVRPYLFIILTRADSDGEAMRFDGPLSYWTRTASLSIPLPPADRGTPARLRAAP